MSDVSVNGLAALSGTLLSLTTAAVALRFVARHRQKTSVQTDDWLTVLALIFFAGLTALTFYGISQRFMGYAEPHNLQLVEETSVEMAKTYLSLDAIAILTLGVAKLSALFFFRRLFCSGPRCAFSWVTMVTIVVVVLWMMTFFIMTFLACGRDISSLWTPGESGNCWLIYPYFMATTVSDFLLDVFILCLPLPKIWSLHATTKRKLAVSCVFLLALVGLGSSTARMALAIHLETAGKGINDEDPYQTNTSWAYFVVLEAGLTIIAVNLPSLWYFVADTTPERVLRSVRSFMSLGSVKTTEPFNHLAEENRRAGTTELGRDSSSSQLTPHGKSSVETYAMTDMASRMDTETPSSTVQGIRVERSFQRREEQV